MSLRHNVGSSQRKYLRLISKNTVISMRMRTIICVNLNAIQTDQFCAGCLHFMVLVTPYVSVTTPREKWNPI